MTINPNKALWEKGDFTKIAENMRESGAQIIDDLKITRGMRVLDLGCGDGTTALPAARLGAEVLGVDIAENLVAAGNKRAAAEGLSNCKFQEGDASNLIGVEGGAYDLVISMFGAMFAPRPFDVAKEMVRVTRPGGRVVMGNWIPGDPTLVAQILKISASYLPPPPPEFVSPMTWGLQSDVTERFLRAGVPRDNISFLKDSWSFRYAGSPSDLLDIFINFYGPMMNAFEAAELAGRAGEFRRELQALFESQNQSSAKGVTEMAASFLKVTVLVN